MEQSVLFNEICKEYDKVYQEMVDGVSIYVPVGKGGVKKAFPIQTKRNWGLTTGKIRKDGKRLGDTTTIERLERLANLNLYQEEDFQNFKGKLHKLIGYNDSDAKYIMQFLYGRVIKRRPDLKSAARNSDADDGDMGIEELCIADNQLTEGGMKHVVVNRFERDRRIRDEYIKANGGICKCAICGFDFETTYGDIGKGFIHMHHKKALAEVREERVTKFEDLILVCPNCHSMLHRANPMLTPEELKERIEKQKQLPK